MLVEECQNILDLAAARYDRGSVGDDNRECTNQISSDLVGAPTTSQMTTANIKIVKFYMHNLLPNNTVKVLKQIATILKHYTSSSTKSFPQIQQ